MNVISSLSTAVIAVSLGGFLWFLIRSAMSYRRQSSDVSLESMFSLVTPFAVTSTASMMMIEALSSPYRLFNDARFALTMAAGRGMPIYPPPNEGVQLPWIYPPLAPILYIPALITSRPDVAMVIAGLLAQVFFFLPIAALVFARDPSDSRGMNSGSLARSMMIFCTVVLACVSTPSLRISGFWIHADSPALGFAGWACMAAWKAMNGQSTTRIQTRWTLAAALLASLSVLSKQTMLPLFPALVLYAATTRGVSAAIRFGLALASTFGLLLGAIGVFFGGRDMLFYVITIPSSHPLAGSLLSGYYAMGSEVIRFLWLPLTFATLHVGLAGAESARELPRGGWTHDLWVIFFLTAMMCLPTAYLGWAKIGGTENSFSFVTYFLLLASISFYRNILRTNRPAAFPSIVTAILLSCGFLLSLRASALEVPYRGWQMRRTPNPTQVVYEYCLDHPGEVYFPLHPAAVLAAEGRLFHEYHAVVERRLANRPITLSHMSAHIPPGSHSLFWDASDHNLDESFMTTYFGNYAPRPQTEPLPFRLRGTLYQPKR